MTLKQPNKDDPIALRKQLIQMRMELNRQKIHHEGLVLLEPIQKARNYKERFTQGANPVLLIVGLTLASFFITRKRHSVSGLIPVLSIATSLARLFINAAPSSQKDSATGPAKEPE